jgi:hypothetical protein
MAAGPVNGGGVPNPDRCREPSVPRLLKVCRELGNQSTSSRPLGCSITLLSLRPSSAFGPLISSPGSTGLRSSSSMMQHHNG